MNKADGGSLPDDAIIYDGDGYLVHLLGSPPPELTHQTRRYAASNLPTISLLAFVIRSTATITSSAADPSRAMADWAAFSLHEAIAQAPSIDPSNLALPIWVQDFQTLAVRTMSPYRDDLEQVVIRPTLEPRLNAWSFPSGKTIRISVITRELFNYVNVCLWESIYKVADAVMAGNVDHTDETYLRVAAKASEDLRVMEILLPFFIALYRELDFTQLRMPLARRDAILAAHRMTGIQVEFMLAHELGHIVMHGDQRISDTSTEDHNGDYIENQADDFALQLLSATSIDETDAVHASLRWLFPVLQIEQTLGEVLYGTEVDWKQSQFGRRSERLGLQRLIRRGATNNGNLSEDLGVYILHSVRNRLQQLGSVGLANLVAEVSRGHKLPDWG